MDRIREHSVRIEDGDLVLRPLTEADWDVLLPWNQDPEVLWFCEGDDIRSWSLEDIHGIYRGVSRRAFVFMIEHEGRPVGECWLQEMNVERILEKEPGKDCRRIDITIGEKDCWGRGLGTRVIRLLLDFAFLEESVDVVFGLTSDHNPRSVRAFEKAGFTVRDRIPTPDGKGDFDLDLAIRRAEYFGEDV